MTSSLLKEIESAGLEVRLDGDRLRVRPPSRLTDCPRNADGTFDLREVIQWREAWLLEERPRASRRSGALEAWRAIKTERERLALEREKGDLLVKDEVVEEWRRRIQILRDDLLRMSERISPLIRSLDQKEVEQVIREDIGNVLRRAAGVQQ